MRRPPRGGRGLKQVRHRIISHSVASPPARGAGIETGPACRSPPRPRRPPRGGRGLKQRRSQIVAPQRVSPPARGAWIETRSESLTPMPSRSSPPARGAWIETHQPPSPVLFGSSPPARGAWIETLFLDVASDGSARRPPRGGRGLKRVWLRVGTTQCLVAPRAGGVD